MTEGIWAPPLPYELVEATEHHGPYICTSYGSTVCDFYAMSDPSALSTRNGGSSRPVLFTDAQEHAAYFTRAVNAHEDLVAALRSAEEALREEGYEDDADQARAAIAKAESRT